jgi:S-adenosylmethionine decarboxylase
LDLLVKAMLEIEQLLVDLYGCEADLDDADFLLDTLRAAADAVGSKVVDEVVHRFSPVGVTVILILAETHISIHTWPEHGYAAVDVFVCGEGKDPNKAWDSLRSALKPESLKMKRLTRTIGVTRL